MNNIEDIKRELARKRKKAVPALLKYLEENPEYEEEAMNRIRSTTPAYYMQRKRKQRKLIQKKIR